MTADINSAKDFLLDIFFPNRCPVCDRFIMWNLSVCEDCESRLSKYRCESDDIISAYRYAGSVLDGIYSLKFAGGRNFAKHCAKIIAPALAGDFDCIVPVPTGKKRRRKRGYNQAEIFAEYLSQITTIPVKKNILKRVIETEQHLLSETERKANAENSYKADKNSGQAAGKRIILADDVLTTGATVTACTKLLYAAGAESVITAVCAKTQKNQS
ncbi:MAG: ComF family protein [Ruminococcus sp.]|jgi:competence protein ComFC|nr:ComF family protein [Ruminococcus sp.]